MQKALPEITALGASLVAITPEKPDGSLSAIEKNELSFEVLSDLGHAWARKLGIAFSVPEYLRPIYHKFGVDLPASNGDESYELPIPVTLVLDKEGIVRTAYVNTDYIKRLEPSEVIAALKSL